MAEVVGEKEVCSKCGVDVRENTLFCYNCGNQVAVEPKAEAASNGDAAVTAKAVTKALMKRNSRVPLKNAATHASASEGRTNMFGSPAEIFG